MINRYLKEALLIFFISAISAIFYNALVANGLPLIYQKIEIQPGNTLELHLLKKLLNRNAVVLIDARSADDFQSGHIPDAVNLPLRSPRNRKIDFLSKFSKNKIFILYCTNPECTQAERLAKQFNLLGFKNTHIFSGGWEAWQNAK